MRTRVRRRAARFVREVTTPLMDERVDVMRTAITTTAEDIRGDSSFSARHVPLETDDDQYWTIPTCELSGFEPADEPPESLRRVGQDFLDGGRRNVEMMRTVLLRHGCDLRDANGILDFGCGVGRMIRWLSDEAAQQPVWGVDIEVAAIRWAQQHLSPPFLFSTCTTAPHLPFDDRSFGLVYAGSVFSHIEDLADAWLLELRRITRPGGYLYLTIHDRASVNDWFTNVPSDPMTLTMKERPDLFEHLGTDHAAIGHRAGGNVWYDSTYLSSLWGGFVDVVAIAELAWFNQTAMVLRRRNDENR